MPTMDLVDRALEQAFVTQVAQLFAVLCVSPSLDAGLEKFALGLDKAVKAYDAVKPDTP